MLAARRCGRRAEPGAVGTLQVERVGQQSSRAGPTGVDPTGLDLA
jgi:hypothetical protein